MTASEFIEKATKVHNGKYDYSQTVYLNSRTKVTIICPEHGPFDQCPYSHLQGNGCPKCARVWSEEHKRNHQISARKSSGMTTEEWIDRAKGVHGDKYDYSQTCYVNQRIKVKIICPIHGLFEQNPDSHLHGHGCKFCGHEVAIIKADHHWSDTQHRKIRETCMARYGALRYLDSDEGRERMADIRSTSEFRQKLSVKNSSAEVQNKMKATCRERYGADFAVQTKDVQDKIYATKKKNHTVNSSKVEIEMYRLLVARFGVEDVIHQYKHDARYPFVCDFYVKSLDLFIELNAHWSHGHHAFNSESNDAAILEQWQLKASTSCYYREAIITWTIRDVAKRTMAIQNGLNYLVFWDNNLNDFKQWLFNEPLILNNII